MLCQASVQLSPSCGCDSAIHHVLVERMRKFVTGRRTGAVISEACRADNLMPSRKPLDQFLECLRLNIGDCGSNRHRQGKPLWQAHDREDALLLCAQPLNPEFDHLPQGLRRLQIDLLQWHTEM